MENNNGEAAPAAGDGRDQIRPLTGSPYFHFIITQTSMNSVWVPKKISDLLPCSTVEASVSCGGRWWRVTYQGDWYSKRIQTGWRKFVDDNRIRVGDACVFEVLDRGSRGTKVKFTVQILRASGVRGGGGGGRASRSRVDPEMNAGEGRDPEDPIIVD